MTILDVVIPNWLMIVIVIVAFLAIGMARERWRISGIEKMVKGRGLVVRTPFEPTERPPTAMLARRFDVRGGRIWGMGVEGLCDNQEVTIAEHETTPPGKKTSVWQTLIVWRITGPPSPLVLWPAARAATQAETDRPVEGSDLRVAERLGMPDADPAPLRVITPGGLVIEGIADVRRAWLSVARQEAVEAWPHGGDFVVDQEYAAWRVEGLLTPARLDDLLTQLREARRILG